jgi:SET domain-containing protein
MIHPDTEVRFISPKIGYGVVATKFIPKGTITWVQDELDRVYTPAEADALSPYIRTHLDTYCFTNKYGEKVLCWDNGKFVNHSFNPSCFSTSYDFEIAIRDIYPGEELTDDYGYLNVEKPFEAADEGTDRKIVFPDDLVTFHKDWDELVKRNIPFVFEVEQPMRQLISDEKWAAFEKLKKEPSQMISLLECYYKAI